MGVSISAIDGPVPKQIKMLLSCDADHGGLTGSIDELVGESYLTIHSKAVRAGWRFLRDGQLLGPCCTRPE